MCSCPQCSWRFFTEFETTFTCPKCSTKTQCKGVPASEAFKDLPNPFWVAQVSRLRKADDKGVGDTVQRVARWFGGELFKTFAAKIGMPCGCTQRQDEWNKLYPYG